MRGASARTTAIAAGASARSSRYSDCSSAPALGVNSRRKWGGADATGRARPAGACTWPGRRPGSDGGAARSPRAEELPRVCVSTPGAEATLDPQRAGVLAPEREHADAVAGGRELVETLLDGSPGQALIDALADRIVRLDVEPDARHRAERAERDHGAVEVLLAAAQREQLAA